MRERKGFILYFICVLILFLFLYVCVNIFEKKETLYKERLYNKFLNYKEEKIGNITYPTFDYPLIDKKVNEIVKESKGKDFYYNVFVNKELISLYIQVNADKKEYFNVNYSISEGKFVSNKYVFDVTSIKDFIFDNIKHKYFTMIYESVVKDDLESTYIKLTENGVYIYFDSKLFNSINYSVNVLFSEEEPVNNLLYDKVIAFTFDDGPGEYTMDVVRALILNEAGATFFELGNRMKYNQDIVREVYNNGMEIGSHTYAHKSLTRLSDKEILEEVNSTNIIYNEITGDNIKLLRPPYGNVNTKVKELVTTPIINWNIDTNDWLYRDSDRIANHILENVEDGDIVLMHDIYPETLEAVKKVLPALRDKGFKVTSVSELAKEKNIILEPHQVYRSISK